MGANEGLKAREGGLRREMWRREEETKSRRVEQHLFASLRLRDGQAGECGEALLAKSSLLPFQA